jgi:phosphoesterase RecJ-like protein
MEKLMSKLLTALETAQWLKERDSFLLITHRRPDGDTLGSAGALTQALREYGKTAYVLFNKEITPRYSKYIDDCIAPDDFIPSNIITVDIASVDLFPDNAKSYVDNISLCIDHHGSNTMFASNTCLNQERASCGEVIYDILTEILDYTISPIVAERLYVALSTDTGCFMFGNTTSNTLRVASLLVDAGAPIKTLNKELFRTKARSCIKLEGLLNTGLEFYFDGKVAISSITRAMIESTKATEDDMDNIAALPGAVEGVYIGITIREMTSPNDCKISVRASAPYDANEICSNFGGGGHKTAAGATVQKTIDEIKESMLLILDGMI